MRVDKSHPRHEFCLKASERAEILKPVSSAMDGVINGTAKGAEVSAVLENERKDYVAQKNKFYNDCLADFDSLPKNCYDSFNDDYRAKGFDPEKYADFRKDVVGKCVAKGEIEVTCKRVYRGQDVEMCIDHKTKDPSWAIWGTT